MRVNPIRLLRVRRRFLRTIVWRTRIVFWIGALLVGLSSAALALGSEHAHVLFGRLLAINPYLPLLVTPLGLLGITFITRRLIPGSEGSGIPQALAALKLHNRPLRVGLLSFRIAIGKFLMILAGLACGASIGREGPSVHVGAAIMYALHRFARFPHHHIGRGLILAGSAAGLAAAFNTPLAGIVFAIEEMHRSFEERTNGTVLIAVIVAGLIALSLLGNYRYFGTVDATLDLAHAFLPIVVCGVVGGLLGGIFSSLLIWGGRRLAPHRDRHAYLIAVACGLGIALIGLAAGGATYGTGYAEARLALSTPGGTDTAFPFLKLLATLISYWSGIPGGIFAPSLSVGAGLGAELSGWFGSLPYSAIVLLGMVAYFTGVVQTPVTAVVILMEMTANETLLLPLMATAVIANGVSSLVCRRPIYRALADDFVARIHQAEEAHRPAPTPGAG